MLGNLKLGLIILLTGIVVVFSVLVLLILIIKAYSTAVSNAQSRIEALKTDKAEKTVKPDKQEKPKPAEQIEAAASDEVKQELESAADGAIPAEIIAVIAAAVDTIFGEGSAVVTSIKRTDTQRPSKRRSAWKAAGMAENTRAF